MKILHAHVPANCEIYLHGDTHEGNRACAYSELDKFIDMIARKKNARFVHMGDESETTYIDHKYFEEELTGYFEKVDRYDENGKKYQETVFNKDSLPLAQMERVQDRYRKIAKKGLVWLDGNHPLRARKFGNITQMLCKNLGIPHGTWSCKLHLHGPRGLICKMFLTHSAGNITRSKAKDHEQRKANIMASLKRCFVAKHGDCLINAMGHTHQLIYVPPAKILTLYDDGSRLVKDYLEIGDGRAKYIDPDRRMYINTGSFVKTYVEGFNTYSEIAGHDPAETGYAKVTIKNEKVVSGELIYL